ncbi:hypothetical protein Dimus_032484 [Dionaea muscipula]
MGNYNSCYHGEKSEAHEVIKIIDHEGNLQRVRAGTTAAEMMLDNPGYVLSPAREIRRNHRVKAVKADEELMGGEVYMLVPFGRIHHTASESDMALVQSLFCGGSLKVSPAAGGGSSGGTGGEERVEEEGYGSGMVTGLVGGQQYLRVIGGRTWTPVLEPILEGR